MGRIDTESISPESLRSLDTRETGIPHSNSGRAPLQRYRNTIKLWEAKTDGETIFVLLGGEIQDKVHYAMPVRDGLYDFLNYANQVEVKRKHYRDQMKNANDQKADIGKMPAAEYLAGFRKEDKLMQTVRTLSML